MKCCPDCFCDEVAKETIRHSCQPIPGICETCGRHADLLLEVEPESELASYFDQMLSVFDEKVAEDAKDAFLSLYEAFCYIWPILNGVSEDSFQSLLKALFPQDMRVEKLLSSGVVLAPERGSKRVEDFAFFGERTWKDFATQIKHERRYHASVENKEVLGNILNALARDIDSSEGTWFRARNWNNKTKPPSFDELREPDPCKSAEGRMSPKGVRCLYLADTKETAMAEIRSAVHDEVAILQLRPNRTLKILDLRRIDQISPFTPEVDSSELASNRDNLIEMKRDLARPMRDNDDAIDYIPTQYIADYARSLGFDGIGYESVLHENDSGVPGYNIACFLGASEAFEEVSIDLYKITKVRRDSVLRVCP